MMSKACNNPGCMDENGQHRPMKRYVPLTAQEYIAQHGLAEYQAAKAYWPTHGLYEDEAWLSGFSRWTVCTGPSCEHFNADTGECKKDKNGRCPKDRPDLLLDYAPEYVHRFLIKMVLGECAGGWVRHLTAPSGLETWHQEVNEGRADAGLDEIPLHPSIQIRTDKGYDALSEEKVYVPELQYNEDGTYTILPVPHPETPKIVVPFDGAPILTSKPSRIAHCKLEDLKPGHSVDENAWDDYYYPTSKKHRGQTTVSWKHNHDEMDKMVWWEPPLYDEDGTRLHGPNPATEYNLLDEHIRAHHNGIKRNNEGDHRHWFLLITSDMSSHLNKHGKKAYVNLADRPADFDKWAPMDHHGVEPYEVHAAVGSSGKYLMLPSRRRLSDPYYHSHDECPAAQLLRELDGNTGPDEYRVIVKKKVLDNENSSKTVLRKIVLEVFPTRDKANEFLATLDKKLKPTIEKVNPLEEALRAECKKHSRKHIDPVTGELVPGFRCFVGKKEESIKAHKDAAHRFGQRKCEVIVPAREQCGLPTVRKQRSKTTGQMEEIHGFCKRYIEPGKPCQVKGTERGPNVINDKGNSVKGPFLSHGTEHSGVTKECGTRWPCREHDGVVGNYDERRFDQESMGGEPHYISGTRVSGTYIDGSTWNYYLPPATLLVHDHAGNEEDDPNYPDPAQRFHAPLLTRDKLLGVGKPGDENYVKKAEYVFLVAEAAHKAAACAYYCKLYGLDATVISVASVTLWANAPEFGYKNPVTGEEIADAIGPMLKGRTVIIVLDNDGVANPNVLAQMECLRQKLMKSDHPAKEVLLTAPPHHGYDKLGVDDLCGSLYKDFGGLGSLLIYKRKTPSRVIGKDLWSLFQKNEEMSQHREAAKNFTKLREMALLLSSMAGRLPTVRKACKTCKNEDGTAVVPPPLKGMGVEELPNYVVAAPYSAIQTVLGIKAEVTVDAYFEDLIELGWMVEWDMDADPNYKFNKKTREIEVEKTRYFMLLNPEHAPDDCLDCNNYYLSTWSGFGQLLNGDEGYVYFDVDPGELYPEGF